MNRQIVVICCAALLILLFGYNSMDKLMAGRAFAYELYNQPLPKDWAPFLQYGIPLVNGTILILLMFRRTDRVGFMAAMVWLGIFSAYIVAVLVHAFSFIPCSCAGVIKGMTWEWHLVFNLFFIGTAATGLFSRRPWHGVPIAANGET